MANYLIEIKDEQTFFHAIRKILKEELTQNKSCKTEDSISSDSQFIKADEVCKLLKITRPTIDDWVEQGFFKKYKVRSRAFYDKEEILEFLKKQS